MALLLEHDADTRILYKGQTPEAWALQGDYQDIVQLLRAHEEKEAKVESA